MPAPESPPPARSGGRKWLKGSAMWSLQIPRMRQRALGSLDEAAGVLAHGVDLLELLNSLGQHLDLIAIAINRRLIE